MPTRSSIARSSACLDARFAGGDRVVQAHYAVRDVEESASAGVRAAALALRHFVRPLGRNALGASCGLYGNGMAFASDILRRRTMSAHLTEDLELQTELVLEGEIVAFAADAVVEAEIPATLEASQTQNERWERGRIDLAKRAIPALLRRAVRTRGRQRLVAIDAALDHAVPPLSVLAAVVVGLTGWFALASRLVPIASRASRRVGVAIRAHRTCDACRARSPRRTRTASGVPITAARAEGDRVEGKPVAADARAARRGQLDPHHPQRRPTRDEGPADMSTSST